MSSAVLEPVVEQPRQVEFTAATAAQQPAKALKPLYDPHPLLPVFIAGAVSLLLSGAFIGSVLVWLAVRHSGIMAP
jgi:hypothetical protein